MKNHAHLANLRDLLRQLDLTRSPVLIIDDEADQASMNTRVNQADESTTYRRISEISKNDLSQPARSSSRRVPRLPDSLPSCLARSANYCASVPPAVGAARRTDTSDQRQTSRSDACITGTGADASWVMPETRARSAYRHRRTRGDRDCPSSHGGGRGCVARNRRASVSTRHDTSDPVIRAPSAEE